MPESKAKSDSKTEAPKEENLKVFNFTRDNIVIKAKNRKEAEKLLKEQLNPKEEDK